MLLSTAYFPPILHYAWLLKNQEISVEQFETFPKQTFRNRCVILSANGLQSLTVPVIKPNGAKT
ncbi:MAG: WbqC family protein, partial [Bacteroidales bacterium]|nr:WbqC family protein [Bacteroidales bacterium]